jgi:hypothetical protein
VTDWPPLHDYSHSRAVVMGTWTYSFLDSVPAARNSWYRIVSLLTGPLCGWPRNRLLLLDNRHYPGDLPDELVTAFEDVTDVALFYYVGHGQIDSDDQLCMGLTESRSEPNRRATTSLQFSAVRRALLDSDAATKIVILDCCFAALASRPANTLAGLPGEVLDMAAGTGAYTMTATSAYATAWYETGSSSKLPQTYFTKYLIDLIERGIPGQPAGLKLHPLFTQLREILAADKRPVPESRSIDAARDFVFARNAAFPEAQRDPELGLSRFTRRLAETEAGEAAAEVPSIITVGDKAKNARRRLGVAGIATGGIGALAALLIWLVYPDYIASPHVTRPPATVKAGPTATPPARPKTTLTNPATRGGGVVVFSPDGNTIATADLNGRTYLWDTPTGKRTGTLTDPSSLGVIAVAFSSDGSTLAAADDNGSTFLWDTATRTRAATLADPGSVMDVAFSPHGSTLAVADLNGSTYLWDTATGKRIAALADPRSNGVGAVAFSPDGSTLAAADSNGNIYLWNTATGKRTITLTGSDGFGIYKVAFSPHGNFLAATTPNGGRITYLWDTATGKRIATLADPGSVMDVAFSPHGSTLAVADFNGSTYLWDTATGKHIATLADPSSKGVLDVAFSPDGRTLAAADFSGNTYFWNMNWLST